MMIIQILGCILFMIMMFGIDNDYELIIRTENDEQKSYICYKKMFYLTTEEAKAFEETKWINFKNRLAILTISAPILSILLHFH